MKGQKPNIYLIGMMGTGKTSVGKLLAQRLGMEFLDSDCSIERKIGLEIKQIFQAEGESKFRALEDEFITSGHPVDGCIVSCGGGLVAIDGMMAKLKSKGIVVCLWANSETIFDRVKNDRSRPLLQVKNPLLEIQRIINRRQEIYLKANLVIDTDTLKENEVVDAIINHPGLSTYSA